MLPQFNYSSAEIKRVNRVQFGVLSPEEVVCGFVASERFTEEAFALIIIFFLALISAPRPANIGLLSCRKLCLCFM